MHFLLSCVNYFPIIHNLLVLIILITFWKSLKFFLPPLPNLVLFSDNLLVSLLPKALSLLSPPDMTNQSYRSYKWDLTL